MAKPETRVECLHQNSSETCNTLHRSTRNLLIQIFPSAGRSLLAIKHLAHFYGELLQRKGLLQEAIAQILFLPTFESGR